VNTIHQVFQADLRMGEKSSAVDSFEKCMAEKNRMLITLSAVFFTYYFAFIIGAGWFRDIYVLPLIGGLNIGTAFALSQYFFVGGLALIYAYRMKRIDAQIKLFASTWRADHEHN
jgi:uncharacterized membrane protein (DUF485 family)